MNSSKEKAGTYLEDNILTKAQLISLCKEICLVIDCIIENIPEIKKMKEERAKKVAAALVAEQAVKNKSEVDGKKDANKAEQPA